MLENYRVILASNSPRRKELLSGLCIPFEVLTLDGIDESYPDNIASWDIPLFLAKQKCDAYSSYIKDNVMVITADTIVACKGRMLGKPKDYAEAFSMLRYLSGREHTVFTGVCVRTAAMERSFVDRTVVSFSSLSDDEIAFYLKNFCPYDKAGSYGVQEWIGYVGVESIIGSFYNVMGLPVHRLYQVLKEF